MEKSCLYCYGNSETFELIPQEGVYLAKPHGYDGFNCCWDGALSPDGVFYFSLGSEAGNGDYAYLNRYNKRENTIEKCFYTRDAVLPSPRALPGSKIHSAIDFLPDGRIICCNHTTDKAPNHPEWLPYAYYSHTWEGFQGSTLMIYDPKTGHVDNLGIPAPHESMYGGVYSAKNNAYYMLGYQRGHMYKYDLDAHTVRDLGKAIETCSHRLHVGPDGNVYLTSPSGFFLRVNTDTDRVEWTGIRLPKHRSDYGKRFVYRYLSTYMNLDDHRMLMIAGYANHLYEYDTATGKLHDYGEMQGADELFEGFGNYFYCFNGALDSNGVLWYAMTPRLLDVPDAYRDQTTPSAAYLYRWDYRNPDAKAQNLGVMGIPELVCGLISEIRIDCEHNILYASCAADKDNGPPVMCVDLNILSRHLGERGPKHQDGRFYPKPTERGNKDSAQYEGTSLINAHEAFAPERAKQVRLWTELRGDEENSAVIGLYWADSDTVRGVCGQKAPKYAFEIHGETLIKIEPLEGMTEAARAEVLARACPTAATVPEGSKLPHVAGRQYLAVPSCSADWNGNRTLIGTKDGKLCVMNGKHVFSLGLTSGSGAVNALCTNKDATLAWGVCGDPLDIGRVFTYDDENGLGELGLLKWIAKGEDNVVGPDLLSAIACLPDDGKLAIGSGDLTGTVFIATLE
ncbi:MAG: hypothetical protein VB111_04110 [Clostridiaceae bacterium]|nr:hypothetical protein [Clostridiaceae bacterium]